MMPSVTATDLTSYCPMNREIASPISGSSRTSMPSENHLSRASASSPSSAMTPTATLLA